MHELSLLAIQAKQPYLKHITLLGTAYVNRASKDMHAITLACPTTRGHLDHESSLVIGTYMLVVQCDSLQAQMHVILCFICEPMLLCRHQ